MSYALFKVEGTWHYRFQIDNIRRQRSTRERAKGKADTVALRAYEEAVRVAQGGKPIPTLRELAIAWLAVHKQVASHAHLRSVDTFNRLHLYDLGELPVNLITTQLVELARNTHLATHKPASANHWLRILKLLANWAVKREIIPALPWRVKMLKLQKRPRSILPVDVAKAWFVAVDVAARGEPSAATAIRMMFGLGLREGEAAGARWEWIDWQRATYTPGVTKGREAEPVPLPDWLAEHLAPHRKADGLIAAKRNGRQHPPGFARTVMLQANAACATKGITPHRLRGTFATMLSEAGVPIQTIQKVMRHKSPMTTMAYLEKDLDTAVHAQHDIAEKIGFSSRRESGERPAATPHESSLR
ncbi:site-specific integrase [Duganella sp. BJB476]|uniref:tyrosine-type recombinase/integrase n=1 Tax=Duganella sp. BJB476 TaxID=1871176 RepID=UPI000E34ECD2|nr:site-specific integrase [Duganella sp. BJB476]RFP32434.1 site-specific integrase [Duganella sp. BJB476]